MLINAFYEDTNCVEEHIADSQDTYYSLDSAMVVLMVLTLTLKQVEQRWPKNIDVYRNDKQVVGQKLSQEIIEPHFELKRSEIIYTLT
jgi:hypothetical protein